MANTGISKHRQHRHQTAGPRIFIVAAVIVVGEVPPPSPCTCACCAARSARTEFEVLPAKAA
jgi:hypothetical protein